MSDTSPPARIGGMALANGLLVHGPRHWAAAVRDEDGRMVVASGRKRVLSGGRLGDVPLARGVLRLGEAFAVLPAVRRRLPQARFAMEDRRGTLVMAGSAAAGAIARRRVPSVLGQEAIGAVASLVPALVVLRGSRAAVWHAVEHKSISAYEAGGPHEVINAASHAKEHERCGSNLVLPLLLSSTLVNTVTRRLMAKPGLGARSIAAGLAIGGAVEAFSFAGRRPRHPVARVIHGAGHAMQAGFLTREPAARDLLVGRAAMEALVRAEDGARRA